MLTDHEKNLVRMMVVNTSPEYMAEVGALDDETVRAKISEWKATQLETLNYGITVHSQVVAENQAEVNRLNAIKSTLEEA